MPSGSDVGTMTMLGYDPARYHTGRAPIEAASQGIEMGPRDVVFRMNLVSLKPGDNESGAMIMNDFTSGHITSEEAAQLSRTCARNWRATVSSFSTASATGI